MNHNILNPDVYIEKEFKEINRLADRSDLMLARRRCEALYQLYPDHPRVMHGLGLLRYRTGEADGEELIRAAIRKRPDFAGAYQNLGRILFYRLRLDESEEQFRKALECDPDDCKTMAFLAFILATKERYREALDLCYQALAIDPALGQVYSTISGIMMAFGKTAEAIMYTQKALKCKKDFGGHSSLLFALNVMPEITQQEIYEESIAWGQMHTARFIRRAREHFNTIHSNRKIRIGYVSGDFRMHPVGYHLRPVLAAHDKQRFEIYLYNAFPRCDEMTEEFSKYADCYWDISLLPDEKVAEMIRRDGIDILVDLSGHTGYHRLMLFARRPAPVQVSWLGYFNTTGMEAIDYLLSDAITIPPADDCYIKEKVIRLPDCRFCYQAQPYTPEVVSLPALRNGYITFGSFNAIHKMSYEVISLWSRVLLAVPNSRILLKSKSFIDESVKTDFVERFRCFGVTQDRIELRCKSPHAEMLAEYGDMDISLDTFPYNGGATTCEALWMGVPVVTLSGGTPISRQSKSYLYTIGYPEWVADTAEDFVRIAALLADDTDALQNIRMGLRNKVNVSPLCNGKQFTTNLEAVYVQIWRKWCEETNIVELSSINTRKFSTEELYDAAMIFLKDGEPGKAESLFRRVLKRSPHHLRALNGCGRSLEIMGRFGEALRLYMHALRMDAGFIDTYINIGCFYLDRADFIAARKILRRGTLIQPDNIDILLNLGICCRHVGLLEEADRAFRHVLRVDEKNINAVGQMAILSGMRGEISFSLNMLSQASTENPDNDRLLSARMALLQYDESCTQSELLSLSREYGNILSGNKFISRTYPPLDINKQQLRIGFMSADFKYHPVGMLLSSFIKDYDHSCLSIVCYNKNSGPPDALTTWFKANTDGWLDVNGMSDDYVAECIFRDGIDILVDLNGHTDIINNFLPIFARTPAPVQATWLGYGHTTGVLGIDYIIADRNFIRPQDEQWFVETPRYLPHNRFCFTPPTPCPEVVDAPFVENGYVTFGSFNNIAKYSDHVIKIWSRLLLEIPKSRLILKFKSLQDVETRLRICSKFEKFGVSPRRIEFRTESGLFFMMAEFGDVDICLDPFPFTGGMTSLLSLWMGVPVVTMAGELPIGRQTKSFLDSVGLEFLVARNDDEYVSCVLSLVNYPGKLREIRTNLREIMIKSPLCDSTTYSEALKQMFFQMWRDKCSKLISE